jgi:hypothetical protein
MQANATQKQMSNKLNDIHLGIGKIENALLLEFRMNASPADIKEDNDQVSKTLTKLARAAHSFHSSASTVITGGKRSTIWEGSIMGEPLGQEQLRTIQNWIPRPRATDFLGKDEGEDISSTPGSDHLLAGQPLWSPGSLVTKVGESESESDTDSDTEADMITRFHDFAIANYNNGNYPKAEIYFSKVIAKSAKRSNSGVDLTKVQIMQAYVCGAQDKWPEVEKILHGLAVSGSADESLSSAVNHTLALIHLQERSYADAIRFCKRARSSRRKILGKSDPFFYESMLLLARIHEFEGDSAEADVCRTFVPKEWRDYVDLEPLAYLRKLVFWHESLAFSGPDGESAKIARSGSVKLYEVRLRLA